MSVSRRSPAQSLEKVAAYQARIKAENAGTPIRRCKRDFVPRRPTGGTEESELRKHSGAK